MLSRCSAYFFYLLLLFSGGVCPRESGEKRQASDWRATLRTVREAVRRQSSMLRYVDAALDVFCWLHGRGGGGGEEPDWVKTLKGIRNFTHQIDKYLDAVLDMSGGADGLCHHSCSGGFKPVPRPGYSQPPPNGCSSTLFGFQFDTIPSMTKCCNRHDRCYGDCGQEKCVCDEQFQRCLKTICRDMPEMLGSSVKAVCESVVTLLFNLVKHMGCKSYLDSQRQSCVCPNKVKTEL